MVQRAIDIVAAALTTVLLAFGLFGSGLVVCMMPQTTQLLGNNFSGWNEATYPQDTMSELAEAVRSFSIDDTGRPQLEACVRTALEEHFPDIERTLAAGNTGQNAAGNLLSIYTLPASAVDHLEDCIPVFATSRIMIILSLVFAAVGLILLIVRRRRKLAGWIMFATPLAVIGIIVALGIWAFVDFDSLFGQLHTLFFTGGSWIFPADSLLITLFPESFWMGMGIVWVAVSILACLIVSFIGRFVKR